MYLLGKLITPRQFSNALMFVLSLGLFLWVGYDALDGTVEICNKYGGCFSISYSGPGDYSYFLALGLALLLPAIGAVLFWQNLRTRARDRYSSR